MAIRYCDRCVELHGPIFTDPKLIPGLKEARWPLFVPWTGLSPYLCQKHGQEVWDKQDQIIRNGCQRCGTTFEGHSGRSWAKYKEHRFLWLCDNCTYLIGEFKSIFEDQFGPGDF